MYHKDKHRNAHQHFLLLLVTLLLNSLVSCGNDDFEYSNLFYATMQDGTTLKYGKKDTVIHVYASLPRVNPDWPEAGISCDSTDGFTSRDVPQKWQLCHFVFDAGIGLPDGDYYCKPQTCYQWIPCRGNEWVRQFTPYADRMGIWPWSTPKETLMGYHPSTNNLNGGVQARTQIIHIGYAADGSRVDLYYPCRPENLRWYYYWERTF